MKNLIITKMLLEDLNNIKDVLVDYDDFWNYNKIKTEIENENSIFLVAKNHKEILGFAGIWKGVDEVHITNIVTKKDFRKQGIGNIMLGKLIECTKQLNIKVITLEVAKNNKIAQNLYSKYKFKTVGIRKNYYNNTEDALIMTLEI